MPNPNIIPPYPLNMPALSCDLVSAALANPIRWAILKALCDEPMGSSGLMEVVGGTTSTIAKHMNKLMAAGMCVRGKGQFYKIAPPFQPAPGAPRVLDFGHCIIRLDQQQPGS